MKIFDREEISIKNRNKPKAFFVFLACRIDRIERRATETGLT